MDCEDDMDNEFNEEEDFDPDFEDDLGIINYNIRKDSYIKAVIINIKDNYKKINLEYKYEEEQIIILKDPSELLHILLLIYQELVFQAELSKLYPIIIK